MKLPGNTPPQLKCQIDLDRLRKNRGPICRAFLFLVLESEMSRTAVFNQTAGSTNCSVIHLRSRIKLEISDCKLFSVLIKYEDCFLKKIFGGFFKKVLMGKAQFFRMFYFRGAFKNPDAYQNISRLV